MQCTSTNAMCNKQSNAVHLYAYEVVEKMFQSLHLTLFSIFAYLTVYTKIQYTIYKLID